MKLGIATPVVTNVAGAPLTWEKDASIEDIGRVAETADRLGYHHMTCSEHIGLPSSETGRRGARYWDPLATFGYVSARTKQIRLATMTLVLGYHHPLAIVKRYGTLDHVSDGRVILGVGVGSLKEEFDLLGAPFDDRGARGDDALRALRAALPSNEPTYDGEFYSFGGLTVDPCALQPHMPIWIGGRTKRSLRRAVTLADGWCSVRRLDRHRCGVAANAATCQPASRSCCLPTSRSTRWESRRRRKETLRDDGRGRHHDRCPPVSSTTRSSTTSSRSMRWPNCTVRTEDRNMTLLPPLTADEWGDDEYAAVGALFGIPGDDVPRAGSGDARRPDELRHPRRAGASSRDGPGLPDLQRLSAAARGAAAAPA